MDEAFIQAKPEDAAGVMALVKDRAAWMDRVGIRQWNVNRYPEVYPEEYYREEARAGRLYLLRRNGAIASAAVLRQEDGQWEDSAAARALYVHNLVSSLNDKGAGCWAGRRNWQESGGLPSCGWTAPPTMPL